MEKCKKAVEKNRAVDFITKLSEQLAESYANGQGVNHNEGNNLPREAEILEKATTCPGKLKSWIFWKNSWS